MINGYTAQPFVITLKENGTLIEQDSEVLLDKEMGVTTREGIVKVISEFLGNDKGTKVQEYLNSLNENIKYSVSYQKIGTNIEDYFYFRVDQLFIMKITTW